MKKAILLILLLPIYLTAGPFDGKAIPDDSEVPDESTSQVPDNSDTGQTEEISSGRRGCSVTHF